MRYVLNRNQFLFLVATNIQFYSIEIAMAEENSVPKWLNESFLEKHLQNYYSNPKITVQNFRAKSATAKGENYTSIIYRVHTEFTEPSNEDVVSHSFLIR